MHNLFKPENHLNQYLLLILRWFGSEVVSLCMYVASSCIGVNAVGDSVNSRRRTSSYVCLVSVKYLPLIYVAN